MSKMRVVMIAVMALAIPLPCLAQKLEFSLGYSHSNAGSTFGSETISIPGESPQTIAYCSEAGRQSFGPNFQQFFCDRKGMNGFDLSATYTISRYVGIKGAFARHSKSESFVDVFEVGPGETFTANVSTKDRIDSLLAGVQLRDDQSLARIRPYAHVLAGVARQTARFELPGAFNASSKETSFTMRFGGGIDWRVNDRVSLRLIEVNYNPIVAGERPLTGEGIDVPIRINGRTASNFTFGFGLVFRP